MTPPGGRRPRCAPPDHRNDCRNRERRVAIRRIRKSIARLIAALEKERSEIDAEIDAGVCGSPARRTSSPPFRAWGRSAARLLEPDCGPAYLQAVVGRISSL